MTPSVATALPGGTSSTGLTPRTAALLAYLAGPLSGTLLLIVEETSQSVRFHAWQAILGLGTLGAAAVILLGTAFLMVMLSPRAFWAFIWLAAAAAVCWVALWAFCVIQVYRGRHWKMPVAGGYAERLAAR